MDELRKHIQAHQANITKAITTGFSPEEIEKAIPVGTVNKYGKTKMPDGSWKYVKKGGAKAEEKKEEPKKPEIGITYPLSEEYRKRVSSELDKAMEKFQNPGLDPERKAQLQDHIAHLEGMLKKHEEAQEKQKPPERTYAQVKKEYDEAIAERYKWIKKIDVLRTGSWPGEKYKQEASDAIKEEQKAANLVYKLANERKEIMVANPPWDIKKMSEETRTKVKDYLEEIAGETITAGKEAKIQEMLGIELDDPNFQIAYEGNTFSPVPVKYLTVRYGKDSFSGSNRIASATYYP